MPPEVLDLVRCMCDHFGWMRTESLKLHGINPRTSKPWIEQLPEALRGVSLDDQIQRKRHTVLALRIVRCERKEAGVPLPDRKNMIGKPSRKQQLMAASAARAAQDAENHARWAAQAEAEVARAAARKTAPPPRRQPYVESEPVMGPMCRQWY